MHKVEEFVQVIKENNHQQILFDQLWAYHQPRDQKLIEVRIKSTIIDNLLLIAL